MMSLGRVRGQGLGLYIVQLCKKGDQLHCLPCHTSLEYPNTSKVPLQADQHSKVAMSFSLVNKETSKPVTIHQVSKINATNSLVPRPLPQMGS